MKQSLFVDLINPPTYTTKIHIYVDNCNPNHMLLISMECENSCCLQELVFLIKQYVDENSLNEKRNSLLFNLIYIYTFLSFQK